MDGRGVKKGYTGVLLLHEHNDFGTALNNTLRSGGIELIDDQQIFFARIFANIAEAKLFIDNTMDDLSVFFLGNYHI
jgi:hypothetical protein